MALLRRLAPFTSRELGLMEALRPHLEQAYFNARHLERSREAEVWQHGMTLETTARADQLAPLEAAAHLDPTLLGIDHPGQPGATAEEVIQPPVEFAAEVGPSYGSNRKKGRNQSGRLPESLAR